MFYPHEENSDNRSPGIPSNMKLTQADLASRFVSEEEKEDIHIAVIDDGVDPDHPYLQGSHVNEVQVAEAKEGTVPQHGNLVTGLIVGTDQLGVDSSFQCTVYDVAGDSLNTLDTAAVRKALDKIAATTVDIVNMSFGSYAPSRPGHASHLDDLVEQGKILLAAAGNEGRQVNGEEESHYPAAHPGVISVSALGFTDVRFDRNAGADLNHIQHIQEEDQGG